MTPRSKRRRRRLSTPCLLRADLQRYRQSRLHGIKTHFIAFTFHGKVDLGNDICLCLIKRNIVKPTLTQPYQHRYLQPSFCTSVSIWWGACVGCEVNFQTQQFQKTVFKPWYFGQDELSTQQRHVWSQAVEERFWFLPWIFQKNPHSPQLGRKRCYLHVLLQGLGQREVHDPAEQRNIWQFMGITVKASEVIDSDRVRYDSWRLVFTVQDTQDLFVI